MAEKVVVIREDLTSFGKKRLPVVAVILQIYHICSCRFVYFS